ncbi:MAG: hypothetical protein ACI4A5_02660 [Hominilimicola sp.]
MRKVKMPELQNRDCIEIGFGENNKFYYNFQLTILRSLLNEGKIKQVQYELCVKELYNQKYGL